MHKYIENKIIVCILSSSISFPATNVIITHSLLCIFSVPFSMHLFISSFLSFLLLLKQCREVKDLTHNLATQHKFSD